MYLEEESKQTHHFSIRLLRHLLAFSWFLNERFNQFDANVLLEHVQAKASIVGNIHQGYNGTIHFVFYLEGFANGADRSTRLRDIKEFVFALVLAFFGQLLYYHPPPWPNLDRVWEERKVGKVPRFNHGAQIVIKLIFVPPWRY